MNKCNYSECFTRPSYNVRGMPPMYCAAHKNNNMINVLYKLCIHENCTNPAIYDKDGTKLPKTKKIYYPNVYCIKHKIKIKTCSHFGCTNVADFNIKGRKALKCNIHKTDNMIDVRVKARRYANVDNISKLINGII